jgi:NAD(P)-dependent dehydrogenase (short-subunit alcohol dehydrogenase family)
MKLEGKVAIVTGANSGIGKATALGLAKEGATVVLACRDPAKGEAARAEIQASSGNDKVRMLQLDLADTSSIRAFAAAVRSQFPRLDILINNAGLMTRKRSTTAQGIETTFGVNHLGTFLLTLELLPLLEASRPSRVVVVASDLHYRARIDWDDLGAEKHSFSGSTAYNQSKLANVLFTKALARRLQGKGVTVNAIHPGVVTTEIVREYPKLLVKLFQLFTISPEKGATTSIHVATSPELENVSGSYFADCKQKPASNTASDEAAQEKMWAVSEQLLGLAAVAPKSATREAMAGGLA